jgi:hypothetical protein
MIAGFNEVFTIRSIRIGLPLTLDNIKSNDSYKFDALVELINQLIGLIRCKRIFCLRLGSPFG